jgi:two-component system, chemotaxis family, protein-glutamate methylesterase/glutaminase
MNKIRILVVDDSVVMRRLITDALAIDPELEIVGTAPNGRIGLQKIAQLNPDVVTMDIEMPELDGLATLKELRPRYPRLPVIMFSTLTERGGQSTLEALARGASDYVTKPANVGSVTEGLGRVRDELIPKIRALVGRRSPTPSAAKTAPPPTTLPPATTPRPAFHNDGADAIVIGVSTGGPVALARLLPHFPRDLHHPVLIVQHMPPVFTRLLAERLTATCQIKVVEATHGMIAEPGKAYIAPGGFHMTVKRSSGGLMLETNSDPPENSCRPAVDVLFRSAARAFGHRLVAAVLTGMGQDGTRGAAPIREAGGYVIAQDEATSVVWGMPGAVVHAGLANDVLPLDLIAPALLRRARPASSVHAA